MSFERSGSESASSRHRPYEYVVVGGGIHGTCLANHLLATEEYDHADIRILEPRETLLESFAEKADQCGMETLRSTFVQHIDTDSFSLESFADGAGRSGELVRTDQYPARPTLDLFLDHARFVVDRRNIGDCHQQSRVIGVSRRGEFLAVETPEGVINTRRVVLAVGLGARPSRPSWASSLPESGALTHVWDDGFDPETAAAFDGETYVVGGGITAAQLACRLSEGADVTMLSRHELSVELSEADPYWLNWQHIKQELHQLPPGSEARHDLVRAARNDATIPPYVERRLTEAAASDGLDVRRGEIECAHDTGDGLLVRFSDGTTAANVQVVLATGLDSVSTHPLVSGVAESLSLERGAKGFPVLDDQTLAWRRMDGTRSEVYVSGALAEPSVGPYARNVVGARRVAERLLEPATQVGADGERPRFSGTS